MRAHHFPQRFSLSLAALLLGFLGSTALTGPASALSEIPSGSDIDPSATSPIQRTPLPLPSDMDGNTLVPGAQPGVENPDAGRDDEGAPASVHPQIDPDSAPAEVIYDLSRLPEPARRMHQLILDACESGELEKLRPLIGSGDAQTQLTLGEFDGDPIAFVRELAGDDQGQEILAILEEILEAGFVHLDAGTPQEMYVWPYFFAMPLDKLTAPQRVELFRIVTAGDFEEMKSFGTYIFYRVGITPEGRWSFFVAGE